ncbi:MAG: sialidase family protein, partial [Anaerolineae bacterium]
QQVLYRRLEPTGWTSAQPLSGDEPLSVNRLRPTVVWPAIAAQGDIVCVAWHGFYPGATQEKEEIYLRCSKDGGATWGPVMNVSQSPDKLSLFPAIAIGANGVIHLAWEEFQGGNNYFLNYDAMYAQGPSEVWRVFLPLVLRSW